MSKISKPHKSGASLVLSLTGMITPGRTYMVLETTPAGTDEKAIVVSETQKDWDLKTPASRAKTVVARKEGRSTVLSLTGFVEEGQEYLISDSIPDCLIIKKYVPPPEEVDEGELYTQQQESNAEILKEDEFRELVKTVDELSKRVADLERKLASQEA